MRGSGDGGGSTSVLVLEYVTGGGLAGRDLPPSWAAEGSAMRRAVVDDFAAVPGVRVVTTRDARLPPDGERPGVTVRIITDGDPVALPALAAGADWTVPIAPETGGLLADLTRAIGRAGGRSLGSEAGAIATVADKGRLAALFRARAIPTPPTRTVVPSRGLPIEWKGPIILKPIDGAGSLDTFVIRAEGIGPGVPDPSRAMLAQPFRPGTPMSASFLVDQYGRATLLAVGRQRVEVDPAGRLTYRGGTVPDPTPVDGAAVARAVLSVPGLRGFVGVDFLAGPRGDVEVLEINPRPTTSYVGLARLLPPGTIAGAWLAAAAGGLDGTGWPGRLRPARMAKPVTFAADGSIGGPGWTP